MRLLDTDPFSAKGLPDLLAHVLGDLNAPPCFRFAHGFVVARIAGSDGKGSQLFRILQGIRPARLLGAQLQQP